MTQISIKESRQDTKAQRYLNYLFAPLRLCVTFLLLLLPACRGAAVPTPSPTAAPTSSPTVAVSESWPWWNETIFYEVFVRSFYDSDGDGVGDLPGLIEKLDYLNDGDPNTSEDLGVTGLWLMPIMQSPSYHGYDVVDYYQVDDEYGTNADFQRLMEEAHQRGMRVIVDLVLNHTGRDHPWFQAAQAPNSDQRDWYIWSEERPSYQGPWGQVVWHPSVHGYYYGVFGEGMPDLNYQNPAVTAQMLDVTRFWLEEMGADGFRLDAIKHLIEDGQTQENTAATHAWLEEFHQVYKEANPQAVAVGEAWSSTSEVVAYIGDEVDLAFEFDLAQSILDTVDSRRRDNFTAALRQVTRSYPPGQYATFLTNHDQNRVLSQLNGDDGQAGLAATLLLTSPGVPFIYYGEELGMTGTKPDELIRRPMQWSVAEGGGFTSGRPWEALDRNYQERTVEGQAADSNSLLSLYRRLVQLRQSHPALQFGKWVEIESSTARVLAFLRHTAGEVILVVVNLGDEPISNYHLILENGPLTGPVQTALLFGQGTPAIPTVTDAGGFWDYRPLAELPAESSFVIRLSKP